MERSKKRIILGFVIVNIVTGVVFTLASFNMFVQSQGDSGSMGVGLVMLALGVFMWLYNAYAIRLRRRENEVEPERVKRARVISLVCFIFSCTILLLVLLGPIMAML